MENSTLAIQLLLLGSAVPVALEAYKATKPRGFYALWAVTVLMVLGGIFFPALARAWPVAGTALVNLAASPTTWFTLAMGLFILLRPYWTRERAGESSPSASSYDDTKLQLEVADLAKTVRAVIEDYQRMSGVELRLTDALDGLKTSVRDEFESIRMELQVVERKANEAAELTVKLEAIRVDGAIATKNIEKLEAGLEDEGKRRRFSLYTVFARERLIELAATMRQDESDLYDRLKAGEIYDTEKWNQWENVHGHWQTALHAWIDLAQWYAPHGVVHAIKNVTDAQYAQQWSVADNQFPTAEAVRRFRKHRIVLKQWEDITPAIMANVVNGAYFGMSEEDVRR